MYPAAAPEAVTTRAVDFHERADYWAELVDANQCRLGYEFPDRTDFRGHWAGRYTRSNWRSAPPGPLPAK